MVTVHDQRLIPPAELIALFRGDPFTGEGEEWAGVMPVVLHSSFILHPSTRVAPGVSTASAAPGWQTRPAFGVSRCQTGETWRIQKCQ